MSHLLTRSQLRRIAVLANCDERTVARRVAGLPTRPTATRLIDQALVELGLEPGADARQAAALGLGLDREEP